MQYGREPGGIASRQGYLCKIIMPLTNQSLTAAMIQTNAARQFPRSAHIVSFSLPINHVLTIIAPKNESLLWSNFVADLDRRKG